MLLVVGTQAAIIGAAMVSARLRRKRAIAQLEPVALGLPVGNVVGNERLLHAVLGAAFEVEHAASLSRHLGGNKRKADLTQAGSLTQK